MFGLNKIYSNPVSRKKAVIAAAVALSLLVTLAGGTYFSAKFATVKRLYGVKLNEAKSFEELKVGYLTKKAELDHTRRKALGAESRSVVALTEEIGREAGVAGRITGLKSLGESADGVFIKSGVELRIERIELNELVNLLYMIENHRLLFVISDFRLKSRFDDNNLMDVTMKLARIKKSI